MEWFQEKLWILDVPSEQRVRTLIPHPGNWDRNTGPRITIATIITPPFTNKLYTIQLPLLALPPHQQLFLLLHVRPMSDQFALVPRALSDRFFSAIGAFYACDGVSWPPPVSWWQPDCHGMSFEESVLFRHIHAVGIPYRLFSMFEYVIARGEGGGVCKLGTSDYIHTCNVLVGLSTGMLIKPPLDRWVYACRVVSALLAGIVVEFF